MLPQQLQPTSDLGQTNSASGEEICRRYIWGTCNKFQDCLFRHELDINKMKDILQFCHDYQNRNGCTRENCKYLHATKEEQNLFLATGQMPRVLAERHAAMATAATATVTNAETIPQIAMFISESYMTHPPPSPWPPLPPPQATLPPTATAPPPPPASPLPQANALVSPSVQNPPPPANTPAPATPGITQSHSAPSTYPAMSTQSPVLFSLNQPPPLVPPNFDASRPPPPIPNSIQGNTQTLLKRKVDLNGTAGPSKIRKPEGSDIQETHCDICVQRELRIDSYKVQMEALHNEEETQILIYKKKLQEYELGKEILKSLVGPELFRLFDDLIEGSQTSHDNSSNITSPFLSGSSAVPVQALLQLLEMFIGGGQRNVSEPIPSTSRTDETLRSLASLSRRLNVNNYSNPGPDLINIVIESLRTSSAADRPPSMDVRSNEVPQLNRLDNHRTNGLHAVSNGQKTPPSISEAVRFGAYPGASVRDSAVLPPGPSYQPACPAYPGAAPGPPAAPPAPPVPPVLPVPTPSAFPMFHPAVPPPLNRPFYGPGPATLNGSNMPYNGADRMANPGPPQMMQPSPPSNATRPNQSSASNFNYMGRYSQHP